MKVSFFFLILLTLHIHGGSKELIEQLGSYDKSLRVTSAEFKDLLAKTKKLSDKELDELLNADLQERQLKNLLAVISRMDDKQKSFRLLFSKALNSDKHKSLYCYFAYIVYEPEYLAEYKQQLVGLKDIKPFLSVLDSRSSSDAFEIILQHHNKKNSLAEALLNTVSEENLETVLNIFKNDSKLGHQLASKILKVDAEKFSADTSLIMLKARNSQKKEVFTPEQIRELALLYQQLNDESFNNIAPQILSSQFSTGLNHKTRNQINLNSELISQIFLGKALNFDFATFKKYKDYIKDLHSAELKDRLKSLLKLRDFADPMLAPTFFHLLNDPSADVRRDSLDCLTSLVENNSSSMSAFFPIREKSLRIGPDGMPVTNQGPSAAQEKYVNSIILLLNDPAPAVTVAAIELLTLLNNETANKQIAQLLSSTDRHILLAAIASVEKNEVPEALLDLIDLLKHSDWQIRARAAKAINAFDNKGQYLSSLEKLFFKEKDPYVKNNIFNFLTKTSNQKVFDYLKETAKNAKTPSVKYQNLVQLLKLKNIPLSEVEALRELFHKFENSEFSDTWLRIAADKKLDIRNEIPMVFSKGTASNKEQALWVSGRLGIDITPYLSGNAYREIGYSNLFYYLRSNRLLDLNSKLKILSAIFNDPDFPEYTEALERLHSNIDEDMHLNEGDRTKIEELLNSVKAKVPKTAQLMISIILKEEVPDDSINYIMEEFKKPEKQSEVSPLINMLAGTMSGAQVKKYEAQITAMLMDHTLYPYDLSDNLKELSLENLKKLFQNGDTYQDNYLKAMASKLPMKDILNLSKEITGSRNISQYEIFEALGEAVPTMKEDDLLPLIESMEKNGRRNIWELSELIGKIPDKVRSSGFSLYKNAKIEASPFLFYIIAQKFDSKEFDSFYKFLSETKIDTSIFSYGGGRTDFNMFNNSIISKIENTKIDFKSLQFFENVLLLSRSGLIKNISIKSLEKQAVNLDKKYYGKVFEVLENSGSQSEVYFDLYLKLLDGNGDPVIFKQQLESEDTRMLRNFSPPPPEDSSAVSLLKKLLTKKDKSAEYKEKVIQRLIELKDKLDGAKLNAIALRLSKLIDANQYILQLYKNFKTNPHLITFLPNGDVSVESFKLIKENVDLKIIPEMTAMNIGTKLDAALAKELIAEYRTSPESGLWPFIINKLEQSETDIILSKTMTMISSLKDSIFNDMRNNSRNQLRVLIGKLKKPVINTQIHNYLTANIDNIEKVYALALLNVKVPASSLSHFLKLQDLTDAQKEMLINTFYINKTFTKEVFAFHEAYLSSLKGKALSDAVKLNIDYHHGNQERDRGSFSTDDMTIRQIISYSGLAYNDYYMDYDTKSKSYPVPEDAQAAYKSLKAKKLAVYKLANDPSLFQYVADKESLTLSMSIKALQGDIEELEGPLLETLNSQIKKATHEELKTFLDLLDRKEIYLDNDGETDFFDGIDDKKVAFLKSYLEKNKSENIQYLLKPILYKTLKTDEDFDKLLIGMLKPGNDSYYNDIEYLEPYMDKFKKALFRYLDNNDFKNMGSADVISYILSELELSHEEILKIDEKINTFPKQAQQSFMRTVLQHGPYYPSALKLQLKMLEKPTMQNVNLDLMYLYYEEKLDEKKLTAVKETFDKIQKKKLEIYQKPPNPRLKSLTLIFHQDLEFIKKELDENIKKNTLIPFDYYILERLPKNEHEKYAKIFWDKVKNTKQSYYVLEYFRKFEYSWLPQEEFDDNSIDLIE